MATILQISFQIGWVGASPSYVKYNAFVTFLIVLSFHHAHRSYHFTDFHA